MNWTEKRALKRATTLLPLLPGDRVVDFDLASPRWAILPEPPFPFPLSSTVKRVSLVATEMGLWIEAGGQVHQHLWSELLRADFVQGDPRSPRSVTFRWRTIDERKGQLDIGVGRPSFRSAVLDSVAGYEASLSATERDARSRQRSDLQLREDRRSRRAELVRQFNSYEFLQHRKQLRAVATTTSGKSSPVEPLGVELVSSGIGVASPAFRGIVPYESIREFEVEDGVLRIEFSGSDLADLTVESDGEWDVAEWADTLKDLVR